MQTAHLRVLAKERNDSEEQQLAVADSRNATNTAQRRRKRQTNIELRKTVDIPTVESALRDDVPVVDGKGEDTLNDE